MVMTDSVVDSLTHIRNANMVKRETLEISASRVKRDIAGISKREGFTRDVEYIEDDKQGVIRVFPKYDGSGERVITNLKRVSKPGLRAYVKADKVLKVSNSLGVTIVSISGGVTIDREARAKNIGGEVTTYVW